MIRRSLKVFVLCLPALLAPSQAPAFASPSVLTLAGTWDFALDPEDVGTREAWHSEELRETVYLAGTTDEFGAGAKTVGSTGEHLSRVWTYVGPAWYQREVHIPVAWHGKHIELFLERCHWTTRVWVDGRAQGERDSLVAPHVYDLTDVLTPGPHRLTIRVDNTLKVNVGGWAHSVTDETQTNWNGIVGRIELRATDPVRITALQAYPSRLMHGFEVRAAFRGDGAAPAEGEYVARVLDASGAAVLAERRGRVAIPAGGDHVAGFTLRLPKDAPLWDEWEGNTLRLELALTARSDGRAVCDERSADIGLREFSARGSQFLLNGRPFAIRGTLECCIFPLTGHPPMDVPAWERLFETAREYGLNHFRFHSWCPPEAAFVAADRTGMTVQVELPVWTSVGTDPAVDAFMRAEGERILETYGNHPSFTMLCLGNELSGDFGVMDDLVRHLRSLDPRHLYTFASDCNRLEPGPASDYMVGYATKAGPIRMNGDGARFANGPSTEFDYARRLEPVGVPFVAHELGQWVTHPGYEELERYTGVLKPRSLEGYRELLARRGMLDQAADFQWASGRLAWLVYKEEMETVLRTPGCGGFQLLALQDFPGQHEALCGLLDSFWTTKGIVTPAEMREVCGPTVLLARLPRFVWRSTETLTAEAQIAHYGKAPLRGLAVRWSLTDEEGAVFARGALPSRDVALGEVTDLGSLSVPLHAVTEARRLTLTLQAGSVTNSWPVWVYPEEVSEQAPPGVRVATAWTDDVAEALDRGERVALLLGPAFEGERAVPTRFLPVFWSFTMFRGQSGTCGVLCDPSHPALAGFPTEGHANWQWWELLEGGRCLDQEGAPEGLRPIVQGIDDFHRALRLSAVFECRVGEGRLLVSSLDLVSDLASRPVARQLRRSLLDYCASPAFSPSVPLTAGEARDLVRETPALPVVSEPPDLTSARLRVAAAAGLSEQGVSRPWLPVADEVAAAVGYGYTVTATGSWLDETDSAWHGSTLTVEVSAPKGVSGTLFVHWGDWNLLGRRGIVRVDGERYRLGGHAPGVWSAIPITPEQSADGKIVVSGECLAGPNLMVSDVAFVAE